MKKIIKISRLLFLLFLLSIFSRGKVYSGGAGTTGATFLRIKAGPRAVAMGGAYTALSGRGFGMYWNPAGISRLGATTLSATHQTQIFDVNNEFISLGLPLSPYQTFGLSSRYLHTTDYFRTERSDGAEFTNYSGSLGVYYAYGGQTGMSYGFGGKYIQEKLASYKASSYALDLGIHYVSPRTPLQLGASLQHAGPEITFIEAGDPLPLTIRSGWAYEFHPFGRRWIVSNDVIYYQPENIISFALGTEYHPLSFLDLRAGYLTSQDYSSGGKVHAGLGVNYGAFALDYSMSRREHLDTLHVFSLSLALGDRAEPKPYRTRPQISPREKQKEEFKKGLEKELQQLVPREEPLQNSMVEYWNQQAEIHFQAGEYKKAIQLWEKSLKVKSMQPGIYRHLGVAYYQLGKLKKAKKYLEKATEQK